jgi:hypothetical protein
MSYRKVRMSFLKYVAGLGLTLMLAACGGGGGSAGTPLSGATGSNSNSSATVSTTTTTTVSTPTMALTFVDENENEITNHILSQTAKFYLKVVLGGGANVSYKRVKITLDSTEAVLVPTSGTQLTDASGKVLVRILPSSVSSSGTVRATADATVDTTQLTKFYDLQISPGTVGLSAVTVSSSTVQKGQSINVSVDVTVDSNVATSNSVAVTFTTSCGTVSPALSPVVTGGKALAVIQTTSAGSCSVDASVNGVNTSPAATPATYTVNSPPVTGIQFVSATPTVLYQSGSAGITTSIVKFKVIDSVAAGVQGVTVNASLTNTDGGINFCNSPSTGTSALDGTVTFSVCAGTLPATVQVRAEIVSNGTTIFTNSNLLTIQTGLPSQRFFDISANQLNFYAGGYFTSKVNGNSVTISVFAADRQGNPVPDGTKIVFVSEGGQINSAGQSSCLITNGRCSVTLIGQDYRPMGSGTTDGCAAGFVNYSTTPPTCLRAGGDPRPGRVTVLAYTDGEESFIDANNNNRYDPGELFEDLGSLYMDNDENGLFNASYQNLITLTNEGEFSYPMPKDLAAIPPWNSTGTAACPTNSNVGLSVQSTCNGTWNGLTKVRRSIVIVFSGGEIGQKTVDYDYDASIPSYKRTEVLAKSSSAVTVRLADFDGNPLPSDASLSVEVKAPTGDLCAASILDTQIGNSTEPTGHMATLSNCLGGGIETVRFKVSVTSANGSKNSALDVVIP